MHTQQRIDQTLPSEGHRLLGLEPAVQTMLLARHDRPEIEFITPERRDVNQPDSFLFQRLGHEIL